jgi:hypothetical protein
MTQNHGSLKSFGNPRPTDFTPKQNYFKNLEPKVTKGRVFRATKEPPNTG